MPPVKAKRKIDDTAVVSDIGRLMGMTPPQDLVTESAALSSMLLDPSCVDQAIDELTPECFYAEKNRYIFEAIVALSNEHTPVDSITVCNKLKEQDRLDIVGGIPFVSELTNAIGSAAHIEAYINILKQKHIQRGLITASHKILNEAYRDDIKVDQLVDDATTALYDATQSSERQSVQDIGSVIKKVVEQLDEAQKVEGLSGVPSGFASLDAITNGWQPSDLIILAARPSVGKTAFSLNVARNAAVDHNVPVAFFSLEMSSTQLAKRLMVSESGLNPDKIKGCSKFENDEWVLLEQSLIRLQKAPLYIDETPSLPIMEFRTKVKALVKQKGVRLVVVDYLQLMQGPSDTRGVREQEVAAISRLLKATAKEQNIAIIALSQLSRNSVQRQAGSGKPILSDLRESGSIEQDADMVVFIHRPDFLGLTEGEIDKEKTQIIIAKHRNGETKDIDMLYKGDKLKFVEMGDTLYANTPEYESSMNSLPYSGGVDTGFEAF